MTLTGCRLFGLQSDQISVRNGRLQLTATAGGFAILPSAYNAARGVILEAEVTTLASDAPFYGGGMFVEEESPKTDAEVSQETKGPESPSNEQWHSLG